MPEERLLARAGSLVRRGGNAVAGRLEKESDKLEEKRLAAEVMRKKMIASGDDV